MRPRWRETRLHERGSGGCRRECSREEKGARCAAPAACAAAADDGIHATPPWRIQSPSRRFGCVRSVSPLNSDRDATGLVVHAGAPRPTRSRVTVAGGRCPGSRIVACGRLPRSKQTPSGKLGRRLSAYSCGGSRGIVCLRTRTAFPFDPLREPPPPMLPAGKFSVKHARGCACGSQLPLRRRRTRSVRRERRSPPSSFNLHACCVSRGNVAKSQRKSSKSACHLGPVLAMNINSSAETVPFQPRS